MVIICFEFGDFLGRFAFNRVFYLFFRFIILFLGTKKARTTIALAFIKYIIINYYHHIHGTTAATSCQYIFTLKIFFIFKYM